MTRFAVFYGNRAFMPDEVIDAARPQLEAALTKAGFEFISMDERLTSHGAAETVAEGTIYAGFLQENAGKFDGVIVCLANFSDESATVTALRDCKVPILIQACPDELEKMDFEHRRDAFCGKMAITDVLYQYGIPFSLTRSHTVALDGEEFQQELQKFGAVCRIVKSLRKLTVLAIGARTTAFKSMRFDELTAQKFGISVETVDLSAFFTYMDGVDPLSEAFKARAAYYKAYADCASVPAQAMENMIRASIAAETMAAEYATDCITIRCWDEFQRIKKISVCNMLSELNERGFTAACELDIANAISMKALTGASGCPAACLDFNNNYGDDPEKCILFHCGPVSTSLMKAKGTITEHRMIKKTMGDDFSWGVNQGSIRPMPMTYSSMKTENGKLIAYVDDGRFTGDEIAAGSFGTGGVAQIPNLQKKLYALSKNGFRHHASVTSGWYASAVKEAYETYLGIELLSL
jgi:L-fucose isomerase-like protein